MQAKNPPASAALRIVLVDDFQPWRRSISSLLGAAHQRMCVVGEAADGLDAVEKAQGLQPDVILLDIGLPTLNGIEAASRITKVAPSAKILFVTQNSDADVVKRALSNGAMGYVLKADAKRELLPAIETVFQGGRFISQRIRNASYFGRSAA